VLLSPIVQYYHQQYLAKNKDGYCPDHSTGVSCPVGLFAKEDSVAAGDEQLPAAGA
jgi:peptide-methionine (S)-S-oxide reductase